MYFKIIFQRQIFLWVFREGVHLWRYTWPLTRWCQAPYSSLSPCRHGRVQLQKSIYNDSVQYSSVSQSCPTLCHPHGLQQAWPPCPTPTPRVHPNSCSLSQWCHPTISSSLIPFSSCLQSFPASKSQFFASDGQSIGVSASASDLPMNIQDWFLSGWTGWISLQSKGLSSLLQHHSSKASVLQCSAFFIVQLSHPYLTTGKTIALTRWTSVDKVMSLLFNLLSRLFITFPTSKRQSQTRGK